jgi:hypothetical protein
MHTQAPGQPEQCEWAVARCRRLLNALSTGMITMDECALNLPYRLVSECDRCIDICVESIPDHVVGDLFDSLERFLTPVDFMPCPKLFLAGTPSDEDIERAKLRLRPKYLHLFEAIRARASATRGGIGVSSGGNSSTAKAHPQKSAPTANH